MTKTIEAKGHCLCGAVELVTNSAAVDVGACHCSMCRKWTGGPFLGVECQSDIDFKGETNITHYDSSDWAKRGFCGKCGTHLFYKLKATNQYFVPVGVFNIDSELHFDHQIFIDEKPEYYTFSNETKMMTGAEVFAGFSGENT